jgi:hypothetical protein
MNSRRNLFIVASLAFFTGCTPSTEIVNSWRDPNTVLSSANLNKFVVAALLKNQAVRRQVEDQMASLVPGKAVQSYKELGSGELKENDSACNQRLKTAGFDGFVVMSLVNVDQVSRYVPGNAPMYYASWRGNWSMSWRGFYDPGYYTTDKTYNVEINVYSLKSNKLIWSGNTNSVNPDGKTELFASVSKTVYNKMKTEGFLK